MYPNQEEDRMKLAAPLAASNQQMEMTPAYTAPQPMPVNQEKGMGGQMMDMAKQRAMTGALDAGQSGITSAFTGSSAAPVVASGVEGGTMLGAGTAGAGAGMAAAMPYVGAGILAGKALGLFNSGGHVGPLSPQYNAEGTTGFEGITGRMPTLMKLLFEHRAKNKGIDGDIEAAQEAQRKRNEMYDEWDYQMYGNPGWGGGYHNTGSSGPVSPQYNAEGAGAMATPMMGNLLEHLKAIREIQRAEPGSLHPYEMDFHEEEMERRGLGHLLKFRSEGGPTMPTPIPRPLLGDMNELQGPMVDPWAGSEVRPAIDGGMPVQPMPMPMPRPRQIDMDMETLRNEYIKSLGE